MRHSPSATEPRAHHPRIGPGRSSASSPGLCTKPAEPRPPLADPERNHEEARARPWRREVRGWRARTRRQQGRLGADATSGLPHSAQTPLDLYGAAKQALQYWCRRVAPTKEWAGAGIVLNVVALGFYDTRPCGPHSGRVASRRGADRRRSQQRWRRSSRDHSFAQFLWRRGDAQRAPAAPGEQPCAARGRRLFHSVAPKHASRDPEEASRNGRAWGNRGGPDGLRASVVVRSAKTSAS
jgi:NAD(P)-dependent dehydrogenase (short-subunit alcohol dehydrogenase family)